jgi:hypothetical protein
MYASYICMHTEKVRWAQFDAALCEAVSPSHTYGDSDVDASGRTVIMYVCVYVCSYLHVCIHHICACVREEERRAQFNAALGGVADIYVTYLLYSYAYAALLVTDTS